VFMPEARGDKALFLLGESLNFSVSYLVDVTEGY
jgi:hypothetical protein